MSLPLVIPNFTASDGTLLTAFNPVFQDVLDPIWIQNNRAIGSTNASSITAINETFSDDQFVEAIIGASDAGTGTPIYTGIFVRCGAAGSGNGYGYLLSAAGGTFILRYASGVFAIIASDAQAPSPGDSIRFEAVGNLFTPKLNGVIATVGAFTDGMYASGRGGIGGFRTSSADGLSSVTAGNIGSSNSPLRRNSILNGLGASGPFFNNLLG